MKKTTIGNLTLEKELGEGQFGVVYLSSFKDDNSKKYATKELNRQKVVDDYLKYFKNEVGILSVLKHPNIVKFHSLVKTKENFYLTMELCNGGDLDNALEKYQEKFGKTFSEEIVQYLMRQIIDAFNYIHSQKVVHRDIKLANILVKFDTPEDEKKLNMMKAHIKISDFGISIRGKNAKTVIGSPEYMDPFILEKYKNREDLKTDEAYDQSVDIWSLGVVCYLMLIGKKLFNGRDLDNFCKNVEIGNYYLPTNLSKEVISFINGMLQYNPKDRLNIDELSRHHFLTRDIRNFHKINLDLLGSQVKGQKISINTKDNKRIWDAFNEKEDLFNSIASRMFLEFDSEIRVPYLVPKSNHFMPH